MKMVCIDLHNSQIKYENDICLHTYGRNIDIKY